MKESIRTGVGAIVGVPAAGVGVGMQVHGSTVIGVATANIIKDVIVRAQDNSNGHKSTGGSSDDGNYKTLKKNSDADNVAKDLGYDNAHALKREYVGRGNESRFDIQVDRTSGKVRLVSKDQRTKIEVNETLK